MILVLLSIKSKLRYLNYGFIIRVSLETEYDILGCLFHSLYPSTSIVQYIYNTFYIHELYKDMTHISKRK